MYNTESRNKEIPTINKSPSDINMSHPMSLSAQNRIGLKHIVVQHVLNIILWYLFWTCVMSTQDVRTQITNTSLDRSIITMSVGEVLVNSTDLFFWDLTNWILILIHISVTVYEWLPRKRNKVFTLHHPVKIIRTMLLDTPLASLMKLSVQIQWHGSSCLWILIYVHVDSPN